jgi:hypothetical protein
MEASERDTTRDWLLPDVARPPLLSDLVARIDEALATARASEAAVMTVGAAALDAAEQAKRAADLAERVSARLLERTGPAPPQPRIAAEPWPSPSQSPQKPAARPRPREDDDPLRDFSARADRLAARLRELQKSPDIPPVWGGPSDAATRRERS